MMLGKFEQNPECVEKQEKQFNIILVGKSSFVKRLLSKSFSHTSRRFSQLTSYTLHLAISLLIAVPAFAANELGNPFIRNFTPKDFKALSQNWDAVQDLRGVMYFGNNEGILEYDGSRWNLIQLTNHGFVRSLAIDRSGKIFVGGLNELGYLAIDAQGKRFYVSLKNKLPLAERTFPDIRNCYATSQGVYFVSASKVFFWDGQTMAAIPYGYGAGSGLVVNGQLLLQDRNRGICRFNGTRPELIAGSESLVFIFAGNSAIMPFPGNKLLVASRSECVLFNPSASGPQEKLTSFPTEVDDYLKKNLLYRSIYVPPNLYAFATSRGGVVLMDHHGRLIQVINKNRGLLDNSTTNLGVDQEHNLWVTMNAGISYIQLHNPLSYFDKLNGVNGAPASIVRHQGRLYVGSNLDAIRLAEYIPDLNNDRLVFEPVRQVMRYCFDFAKIENVLLITTMDGIFQISGMTAQLICSIGELYTICYSRRFPRHVFLGTSEGLVIVKLAFPAMQKPYVKGNIINGGYIQAIKGMVRKIVCDAAGDLWLSMENDGILYLKFSGTDPTRFQITRYTERQGLPRLQKNVAFCFNDEILVGTEDKGVYKGSIPIDPGFNPQALRFVPDPRFAQLLSGEFGRIFRIDQDRAGNYWTSLGKGFGVFNKQRDGSYQWNNTPFKMIDDFIHGCLVEEEGVAWFCAANNKILYRYDAKVQ
jgi:ligand-binding sensor domain-containing protein